MTFKEYFLLRESPDRAAFFLPGKIETTWVSFENENHRPQTIIVADTCIIWAHSSDAFHCHMIQQLGDWADGSESDFPYDHLGTVSDDFEKHLESMADNYETDRLDLMRRDPKILMARSWIIADATMGISIWNNAQYITSAHKALLKKFIRLQKCDSHLTLYEVEGDQLSADQFANMNASASNSDYEVSNALHLLPSDKKRAALKLQGAVPKTPIPLDQKLRREGD